MTVWRYLERMDSTASRIWLARNQEIHALTVLRAVSLSCGSSMCGPKSALERRSWPGINSFLPGIRDTAWPPFQAPFQFVGQAVDKFPNSYPFTAVNGWKEWERKAWR